MRMLQVTELPVGRLLTVINTKRQQLEETAHLTCRASAISLTNVAGTQSVQEMARKLKQI